MSHLNIYVLIVGGKLGLCPWATALRSVEMTNEFVQVILFLIYAQAMLHIGH